LQKYEKILGEIFVPPSNFFGKSLIKKMAQEERTCAKKE
jgi:hypothetical protein